MSISFTRTNSILYPFFLGSSAAQNGHSNVHHNNMKNNGDHVIYSSEDIPPMMPLLPPIMTSTQGIAETSFNESAENEIRNQQLLIQQQVVLNNLFYSIFFPFFAKCHIFLC